MSKPLSKTDARYWLPRLFKRSGNDYHVQIQLATHQERFPLRTPNKEAAAKIAVDIWNSLHAVGWEETRKKFKPWTNTVEKISSPTVGEFIAVVETYAQIDPATLKVYTRKFRRLVAGVLGVKGDRARFDRTEGSAAWRGKVDAMKLAKLTPAAIGKWKAIYVAEKRGDALAQKRAETTAQSILRNARSLFSKRILRQLEQAKVILDLPSPLPFDGVEIGRAVNHRYASTIDAEQLAGAAQKELAEAALECFKIFLLAFGVGLRRGEIDRLTWRQFNWSKNQINIEATAYGDTKTDSSAAPVDVDPVVMKLFEQFKEKASGEFVIESTVAPRPGANWYHYRANCAFKQLNAWLRGKGVDTPNPIHTLRKEFGTLVCHKFGIFAASEALRHSDIRLTRAHYTDRKAPIFLEVGKMLSGKSNDEG